MVRDAAGPAESERQQLCTVAQLVKRECGKCSRGEVNSVKIQHAFSFVSPSPFHGEV